MIIIVPQTFRYYMKQQSCEIFVENQLIKAIKGAEHCDIISYIIYLILHLIRLIYI